MILPLYCFLHCRNPLDREGQKLPVKENRALIATTLFGSLIPAVILGPALVGCGIHEQQGFIALFQTTPLLLVLVQYCAARVGANFKTDRERSEADQRFKLGSYTFVGTYTAAAHLYVLAKSLLSKDSATALTRIFFPSPGKVDRSAPTRLVEGAHLFLQYDWIVINLTCVLYAYTILTQYQMPVTSHFRISSERTTLILAILAAVVLGPGAAVSFALIAREYSLSSNDIEQKTE